MKAAIEVFKKVYRSEVTCILLLVAALAFDFYYIFLEDPFLDTLTNIGRLHPPFYIVFGAMNVSALVLNLLLFYRNAGIKNKAGYFFIAIGAAGMAISVFTLKVEPRIIYYMHWFGSMLFVAFILTALLIPALKMSLTSKKYFAITAGYLAVGIADIFILLLVNGMGFFEFVPLLSTIVYLFFVNFTKPFRQEKPMTESAAFIEKYSR